MSINMIYIQLASIQFDSTNNIYPIHKPYVTTRYGTLREVSNQ